MNVKFLILIVAVVSVALVIPNDSFAKSKSHSGTQRISCSGVQPASLVTQFSSLGEDEERYNLTIWFDQAPGVCIYKNEHSRFYEVPFVPLRTIVQLIDTDFDFVVQEWQYVGQEESTILIPDLEIYGTIPYCVKITSQWMDANERTENRVNTVCFTL